VPPDVENDFEHFWPACLVMKIKIEEIMGNQRISGWKICRINF
jgi:hypothetical protein